METVLNSIKQKTFIDKKDDPDYKHSNQCTKDVPPQFFEMIEE